MADYRQDIQKFGKYSLGVLGGFRTFILRGNVIDLAIGIVIGAAFTAIVTALVNDVITPLVPVPGGSLATAQWPVPWTGSPLKYGAFINAIITFLIVAFVLYFFVVRPVNSLMARFKPKEVEVVKTKDCPYCLSSVNVLATRCAYCTSPLPPDQAAVQNAQAAAPPAR